MNIFFKPSNLSIERKLPGKYCEIHFFKQTFFKARVISFWSLLSLYNIGTNAQENVCYMMT